METVLCTERFSEDGIDDYNGCDDVNEGDNDSDDVDEGDNDGNDVDEGDNDGDDLEQQNRLNSHNSSQELAFSN